ncbi:MAG: DNA (cytosine-5-)-methyltransferase [Anaerolineaceae bacterium]|nr:DNA (cytosine-5-)-methyltransferase [Anaerolineaceae bacterium]
MRQGSLFTGIGGFDLGFERSGIETAWQCEIDSKASVVLTKHFPGVPNYHDVRSINNDGSIESVDIISGGFPCQDVSLAGKRAGLDGERSGLWYEYQRIIAEFKPKWVVIENVAGLLSSNSGEDFSAILRALDERGYCVSWRILDAQYFGVAQRRRRVFIVGSLGNIGALKVLYESKSMRRIYKKSEEERKESTGFVTLCLTAGYGRRYNPSTETMIVEQNNKVSMPDMISLRSNPAQPVILTEGDDRVRRLTPTECERLQGFPDGWTEGQADTNRYK